jgi:N-acetylmuramoyl-L-alanine amidase CwlA
MNILAKKLSLEEFKSYVKAYDFGKIKPSSLVVHHTWKPTKSDWNGAITIAGLKRFYENKGWNAGPHLFIAEDGIWLFTPMNAVGIHAGAGNATYRLGRLQNYSIGIEVVGDYDLERWSGETLKNALGAIKSLTDELNIANESIFFHRDFSSKSCPGHAITKDWLAAELAKLDSRVELPQPSPWAKDAWEWAKEKELDLSILPTEKVDAQWVFAILHKLRRGK